jgi:hypothetical protein
MIPVRIRDCGKAMVFGENLKGVPQGLKPTLISWQLRHDESHALTRLLLRLTFSRPR